MPTTPELEGTLYWSIMYSPNMQSDYDAALASGITPAEDVSLLALDSTGKIVASKGTSGTRPAYFRMARLVGGVLTFVSCLEQGVEYVLAYSPDQLAHLDANRNWTVRGITDAPFYMSLYHQYRHGTGNTYAFLGGDGITFGLGFINPLTDKYIRFSCLCDCPCPTGQVCDSSGNCAAPGYDCGVVNSGGKVSADRICQVNSDSNKFNSVRGVPLTCDEIGQPGAIGAPREADSSNPVDPPGPAPPKEDDFNIAAQWWFWLIMVVVLLVVGVLIWGVFRSQKVQAQQAAQKAQAQKAREAQRAEQAAQAKQTEATSDAMTTPVSPADVAEPTQPTQPAEVEWWNGPVKPSKPDEQSSPYF